MIPRKHATPAAPVQREWLTLQQAAKMAGYETTGALSKWITRHNKRNPAQAIQRRWGRVHEETLRKALDTDMRSYTPELVIAEGMARDYGKRQKPRKAA